MQTPPTLKHRSGASRRCPETNKISQRPRYSEMRLPAATRGFCMHALCVCKLMLLLLQGPQDDLENLSSLCVWKLMLLLLQGPQDDLENLSVFGN